MTAKTIRTFYSWNLQERALPRRKMIIDRGSARSVIPVIMQMILSRGLWYVSRSTMMAFGCSTLIVHWNPAVPALKSTWLQPWLAHQHEWFCLSLGTCTASKRCSEVMLSQGSLCCCPVEPQQKFVPCSSLVVETSGTWRWLIFGGRCYRHQHRLAACRVVASSKNLQSKPGPRNDLLT